MSIRLLDPKEREILGGVPIMPHKHEILPDGAWIKYMRKYCGRPKLFCFRLRGGHRVSVAEWIVEPRRGVGGIGVCTEIESMECPPDWWPHDLPTPERMRQVSRPGLEVVKELEQVLKAQQDKRLNDLRANSEGRYALAKHHMRHGNDQVAAGLLMGETPYVSEEEGGEDLKMLTAELKGIAKGL